MFIIKGARLFIIYPVVAVVRPPECLIAEPVNQRPACFSGRKEILTWIAKFL